MSIEAFNLQKERCKLAHLNVRGELHGEETVPAIDLKFEFDSANNLLAKLHPDLRVAFYRQDDNRDLVGGDHLPALKFPLMDPTIGWELEVPRVRLVVHAEGGDIVLAGGKANAFKIMMKEGGTINWKFRVQYSDPNKDSLAALSGLLQHVVLVTLESRDEEDEGGDLFDQAEKQAQQPMSEARRLAEQEFGKGDAPVDQLPATLGSPADDPDFQEVKPEAPAASNVEPIAKGRRSKRVAGGANLE